MAAHPGADAGGWRRWSSALALVATGCDTGIDGLDGGGPTARHGAGDPGRLRDAGSPTTRATRAAAAPPAAPTCRPASPRCRRRSTGSATRPAPGGPAARTTSPATSPSSAAGRGRARRRRSWTSYGPDLFGVGLHGAAARRAGRRRPCPASSPRRPPRRSATSRSSTRRSSSSSATRRVTGVRGRVFPGLTVLDRPDRSRPDRRDASPSRPSGGTAQTPPSLVVMPRGAGVLAWLVTVAAPSDGTTPLAAADYYIDATTGDILSVQQVTGEGRVALPWAASAAHVPAPRAPRRDR